VIGVALIGACGENATLVAARHSAYNADRGVLMDEIIAYLDQHEFRDRGWATRFPRDDFEVDRQAGTISTAWHLVNAADPKMSFPKSDFIRLDITIADGPPWRVRVVSHGGQLMMGAELVSEIAGDEQWLTTATNKVIAEIHRRLERYAVHVDN